MSRGSALLLTCRLSMTPRLSLAYANSVKTVALAKTGSGVTGMLRTPYVVVELAVTLPAHEHVELATRPCIGKAVT